MSVCLPFLNGSESGTTGQTEGDTYRRWGNWRAWKTTCLPSKLRGLRIQSRAEAYLFQPQVKQWQGVHPESGNLRTLSPTAAGARVSVKKNMTPAHQVPTVHQASLNTGDQVTPWRPGQIGVLPAAFTDEETEALSKGLGFWAVETRAEFLQSGSIPALYYYVVNIPSPHVALVVKNLSANAGDLRDVGSTPESGRSLGEGHGSPLQYSCLENPMDRGVWWATVHRVSKSQTWLKQLRTCTKLGETGQRKGYVSTLWFIWIFYWKKMHNVRVMRMAAWETAPHIALRNCSKEMGLGVGETIYMWFWQRGSTCNQARIFCRKFLLVSWSFY